METAINNLKAAIINDYNRSNVRDAMKEEFKNNLHVEEGRKYIKVIAGSSVWGFVVAVDNDKKFRKGDILMAAGYATPARNKARGNIFEDYSVAWTGPHYLK